MSLQGAPEETPGRPHRHVAKFPRKVHQVPTVVRELLIIHAFQGGGKRGKGWAPSGGLDRCTGREALAVIVENDSSAPAPSAESAPLVNAVITADARGQIRSFNGSAERLFGRAAADLVGQPLTVLLADRFRQDPLGGLEWFNTADESALIGRTVETAGVRADGVEFPIEISIAAVGAGPDLRFTAVIRDMTERADLQDARRRLADLQDLVIRVMGHDLKGPIGAVQGFLEVASGQIASMPQGPPRDGALHSISKARGAAASMLVTLANARAISRLTVALSEGAAPQVVDAARVVRQAADGMRPLAQAKKHALEVTVPKELKVALPPAFDSVVTNLVSNAIKYTPEGGLIAVSLTTDATSVKLEVTDTGPGIDPQVQPRLFRKFERLSAGPSTEGDGLGLSIVASIVKLADGKVSVHGRLDGKSGSMFRVEIPLRWLPGDPRREPR